MGPRILITEDEFHVLESLVLEPRSPRAPLMRNFADRGLVRSKGGICTLSQAGWRLIRGRRWGAPLPPSAQPIYRQF
jgi:hypothetical protein